MSLKTSLDLPTSPHISPHLPHQVRLVTMLLQTEPEASPTLARTLTRTRTLTLTLTLTLTPTPTLTLTRTLTLTLALPLPLTLPEAARARALHELQVS